MVFRRDRHRPEGYSVRRVFRGALFDSDELDRGEVDLETVDPADEPTEEPSEPWAWHDKEAPDGVCERLREYREFLQRWREEHHDDYDDVPDPEPGDETEEAR